MFALLGDCCFAFGKQLYLEHPVCLPRECECCHLCNQVKKVSEIEPALQIEIVELNTAVLHIQIHLCVNCQILWTRINLMDIGIVLPEEYQ